MKVNMAQDAYKYLEGMLLYIVSEDPQMAFKLYIPLAESDCQQSPSQIKSLHWNYFTMKS